MSVVLAEVGSSAVLAEIRLSVVLTEVGLSVVLTEVGLSVVLAEIGLSAVLAEVGIVGCSFVQAQGTETANSSQRTKSGRNRSEFRLVWVR